jgi:hypothetical protein
VTGLDVEAGVDVTIGLVDPEVLRLVDRPVCDVHRRRQGQPDPAFAIPAEADAATAVVVWDESTKTWLPMESTREGNVLVAT